MLSSSCLADNEAQLVGLFTAFATQFLLKLHCLFCVILCSIFSRRQLIDAAKTMLRTPELKNISTKKEAKALGSPGDAFFGKQGRASFGLQSDS